MSHARLNTGWHLQARVGKKQAGTLPSGRAQPLTSHGGELPPKGPTLSSEPDHIYIGVLSLTIPVPCLSLSPVHFHLYHGLYYTVLERNAVCEDLCGLGCVVPP